MFIEYVAGGRKTRDQELLDSKVRSHTARHSWASSKALQRKRAKKRKQARESDLLIKSEDDAFSQYGNLDESQALTSSSEQVSQEQIHLQRQNPPTSLLWPFTAALFHKPECPPQSYPVHLDSNRLRSVEYFPELWSRWAADVIPNRDDRQIATQTAVQSIVQRCLTDELHMSAFISYVLQRAPSVTISKTFLMQTAGKALEKLRSRIESGRASLEEVVWPIIFLAHYELFGSKSVWAGRAHLKAVVELGGMEYLDEVTKVYIRRMDRGWWSDYPSIFPPIDSARPKWAKLIPEISGRELAGPGFFYYTEVLGDNLLEILPFVVDCVRAGVICQQRAKQGHENELLQNKVIRQCQTLMDSLRRQLPAEQVKVACIYPAMIWLQYTTWVMRDLATRATSSVDAYRKITSHAHANLLRAVDKTWQAQEMLVWAAAVGIATSSDGETRVQYAYRALQLMRQLNIVDFRSACKRYIWFEASAIVDYGLICVAFDEAVRRNPDPTLQQWPMIRRAMISDRRI